MDELSLFSRWLGGMASFVPLSQALRAPRPPGERELGRAGRESLEARTGCGWGDWGLLREEALAEPGKGGAAPFRRC